MKNVICYVSIPLLSRLLILLLIFSASGVATATIVEVNIDGEINEGTVVYVENAFDMAENIQADAVLVVINTPGGLVSSTEKIVSMILTSDIPVITYVYPQGAFSASAGSFILLSGEVSAMCNGTSVGAATPVTVGFGKVENKTINYIASYARSIAEKRGRPADIAEKFVTESLSLTSREAYKKGVIDLVTDSKEDLIRKINEKGLLDVKLDYEIVTAEKPVQAKIFGFISNPQVATILFLVGLYGLIFGLTSPGILPETIGAISLVLSLVGFGAIGINALGILLIALGVLFLIAELATPTYGVLGSASVICITLGAIMLIDEPLMPSNFYSSFRMLIAGIGIGMGALVTFMLMKLVQLRKEKKKVGGEALIGKRGKVMEFSDGSGLAKIDGEIWKIESDDELREGDEVIVTGRDGLILSVKRIK